MAALLVASRPLCPCILPSASSPSHNSITIMKVFATLFSDFQKLQNLRALCPGNAGTPGTLPHTVAVIVLSQGFPLPWLPGHSHLTALGAEPHLFHHVLSLPLSVPKAFSRGFARTQGAVSISVPRMLQNSPHVPPQCQGLPQLSILGNTFPSPTGQEFCSLFSVTQILQPYVGVYPKALATRLTRR